MKSKTFLKKAWRVNTREYTDKGGHRTRATRDELNLKFFAHPDGGTITTNSMVAHIDHAYECAFDEWKYKNFEDLIEGDLIAIVEISKDHFLRACKAARSVRPTYLKIHVNGAMEVEGENDKIGRAYCAIANRHIWRMGKSGKPVPVHYKKVGEDKRFLIDPMYLINAIQGMDDLFTIEVYERMIVLKDDSREAIIMMMEA